MSETNVLVERKIKCLRCRKVPALIGSAAYYVNKGWPHTYACECLHSAGATPEEALAKWIEFRKDKRGGS
jgi:hypothetical protein